MAHAYLWIFIAGIFVSFLTGAGVGMNDLSNAFGTTYGAKVLTLSQIVILASVCEFSGAVSLGGAVTATISGGIANPADFAEEPYLFMYGMLCACGAAFCWLALATWLTLPVSSTHSICGGVMGFALVYGGTRSVSWADSQDDFPYVRGVAPIIASWFISPLLAGAVASIIFGGVRRFVLRPSNSAQRAIVTLPLIIGVTFFLESFFIIYKGAKSVLHWGVGRAVWVALWIAVVAGALSLGLIPVLKRRVARMEQAAAAAAATVVVVDRQQGYNERKREEEMMLRRCNDELPIKVGNAGRLDDKESRSSPHVTAMPAASLTPSPGDEGEGFKMEPTPGAVVNEGSIVGGSDDAVSVVEVQPVTTSGLDVPLYDSQAEMVYRFLQVFTAVCASFAHGASDVSNAVGPLAAIYAVYQTSSVESTTSIPVWVLCLGGSGLVLGLSTFGVRLMRLLGEEITVITPSRGFSAELSTALVVSFASGYGIPVSSTHCITGAVVAISMMDVGIRKVRWIMVLKMYAGWIFTLVVTATVSAIFFAQGINAPSRRA